MSPGDVVHLDGVFLVSPFSGYQAVTAGLISDTYMNVMRLKRQVKVFCFLFSLFFCLSLLFFRAIQSIG